MSVQRLSPYKTPCYKSPLLTMKVPKLPKPRAKKPLPHENIEVEIKELNLTVE